MAVVVGRSPGLGDLVICDFGRELAAALVRNERRPVFLRAEIGRLRGATVTTWQNVVAVKAVFPGAMVTAYLKRRLRRRRPRARRDPEAS